MLGWRLLISAILIPGFAILFYIDHRSGPSAWLLLAVCLALGARATHEMVELLRSRSFSPSLLLTGVLTWALIASGWVGDHQPAHSAAIFERFAALGPIALTYTLSVLAIFLKGVATYRAPGRTIETLGAELLIVSYVGVLLAVTAQLRWVAGADAGYLALGSLLVAAKAGDTGAYTLGRLFGKRQMLPRLSPGKTWMGGLGALLAAGGASILWFQIVAPLFNPDWQPCPWYWALIYGTVIGFVGLIGDLAESLIKRDVGRKDASTLLPGFGGVLDLLDSLLYAGPVAYVMWQILPLATWR